MFIGLMLVMLMLRVVSIKALGSDGVLAFISDCGADSGVYMLDVSRHILIRLTGSDDDQLPQWDGQQLKFVEGTLFPLVFFGASADVIDADAPGFYLPNSSTDTNNIWGQAPDGRWAVAMLRDDNYEIYVTDLGNQQARRLTYNHCDDHYPRWQP